VCPSAEAAAENYKAALADEDGYKKDPLVEHFFMDAFLDKEGGTFIDVGSFDGLNASKTFHLEQKGTGEGPTGWTGLCIEPHPDALAIVAKHRKCKAIQLALSDTEGTAKFSTDTLQVQADGAGLIDVKTKTLAAVMKEEGMETLDMLRLAAGVDDAKILESIVPILGSPAIETISLPQRDSAIDHLLRGHGYIAVYSDELANSPMVKMMSGGKGPATEELRTMYQKIRQPVPEEMATWKVHVNSPAAGSKIKKAQTTIAFKIDNAPAQVKGWLYFDANKIMDITTAESAFVVPDGLPVGRHTLRIVMLDKDDIPSPVEGSSNFWVEA
jgi:hypothetical protein